MRNGPTLQTRSSFASQATQPQRGEKEQRHEREHSMNKGCQEWLPSFSENARFGKGVPLQVEREAAEDSQMDWLAGAPGLERRLFWCEIARETMNILLVILFDQSQH